MARLVVLLVFIGLPAAVAAQGLGDHAAQEKERRESAKKKDQKGDSGYVYTDYDLKAYRPAGSEDDDEDEGDESEVDQGEGQGRSSSSEDDERAQELRRMRAQRVRGRNDPNRAQRDAVSQAQSEVDQIQRRIQELNGKLNPMSRDYIYGQANTGSAANEELRIKEELSQLEENLRNARQDLANANADLAAATGRSTYEPQDPE